MAFEAIAEGLGRTVADFTPVGADQVHRRISQTVGGAERVSAASERALVPSSTSTNIHPHEPSAAYKQMFPVSSARLREAQAPSMTSQSGRESLRHKATVGPEPVVTPPDQLPGRTKQQMSNKFVKERENNECIGGCRNPAKAVAKNLGLRAIGRRVASYFCDFVARVPETLKIGERYGTADFMGPPEKSVTDFRAGLRKLLGAGEEPNDDSSNIQGGPHAEVVGPRP